VIDIRRQKKMQKWPSNYNVRQKKNYGNSNISTCKNINLQQKSSERNQNPFEIS
jgi:hypothetical protein